MYFEYMSIGYCCCMYKFTCFFSIVPKRTRTLSVQCICKRWTSSLSVFLEFRKWPNHQFRFIGVCYRFFNCTRSLQRLFKCYRCKWLFGKYLPRCCCYSLRQYAFSSVCCYKRTNRNRNRSGNRWLF